MDKESSYQLHIAVLLFGLSGLFGKFINLPPFFIVMGRTFIASLTLYIIIKAKRNISLSNALKDYKVFLGGIILAAHWVSFFHSIKISTVAIGLLSFSTFPVFVTFLEPVFFKERILIKDILISFVVLAGLSLVVPDFNLGNNLTMGALYGVFSGFTFALLSLLARSYVSEKEPLNLALFQNLTAFLILLPFNFFYEVHVVMKDIFFLILLGVFCTALAHFLYIKSLKTVKARYASVVASLEPVYGVIFAGIFLGEIPEIRTIIGGFLIISAIFLSGKK